MKINVQEKLAWLRLIRSEQVGVKTFFDLISLYGTAEKALEAIPDMAVRGGRKNPIKIYSQELAKKEMENTNNIGAELLIYIEEEYPERLKNIYDPPPVITVRGDVKLLGKDSIAIVGARNASANGIRFSEGLAKDLGDGGYIIVSGLARGIDTAAHKGSLKTGTIAVIAGGINNIYPPENEKLYNVIAEKGAIIAELPFGAAPKAQHFPQRNRIISGLSLGVVIVEAALKSGSLITARLALEQGREVFAVPGHPQDPRAQGPNRLIKQGAILIESAEDVIRAITSQPFFSKAFEKKPNEYMAHKPEIPKEDELRDLRKLVLEKLSPHSVAIDDLAILCGAPIHHVKAIILELELAGKIERQRGNKVSLLI